MAGSHWGMVAEEAELLRAGENRQLVWLCLLLPSLLGDSALCRGYCLCQVPRAAPSWAQRQRAALPAHLEMLKSHTLRHVGFSALHSRIAGGFPARFPCGDADNAELWVQESLHGEGEQSPAAGSSHTLALAGSRA